MTAKNLPDPAKSQHQAFVKTLMDMGTAWSEFANEYYKSGLTWKFKGANALEFKAGAKPAAAGGGDAKKTVDERLDSLSERLERLAAKLNKGGDGGEPAAVAEYKAFYTTNVLPFIESTKKFPELKKIGDWTETAYSALTKVIAASIVSAKPSDEDFMAFLGPIAKIIEDSAKTDNKSPFFNHQKVFAEGIQALSWVMMPGPSGYVKGQNDAAMLYGNKILMAVKDKADPERQNHRDYVNTHKAMLEGLENYCKDNHKMGLVWKAGGKPLKEYK